MSRLFDLAVTGTLAFGLVACSPPIREPERTGFISDYSRLTLEADESVELTEDEAHTYVSDKLVNYTSFKIDEVVLLYKPDPENRKFEPEELNDLLAHVRSELERALTRDDAYTVVSEPAEGVARVRIALTDVDATIGALNVSSITKVTGAGLGGASVEGEIIDSVTGEQLAAAIRWGGGSRFAKAGLTKTGDAKAILSRWADGLRDDLDKLHGVSGD